MLGKVKQKMKIQWKSDFLNYLTMAWHIQRFGTVRLGQIRLGLV
jgi:hypothetical protein